MKIAPKITLTDVERTTLARWSRGRSTASRLVLRAKIVLLAAEDKMNRDIAAELATLPKTVSLWRRRFADGRLAGIEKDGPAVDASRRNATDWRERSFGRRRKNVPPTPRTGARERWRRN